MALHAHNSWMEEPPPLREEMYQPHVLKQALHLLPATSSLQFSEVFTITEGFTEPLSNFVPLGQLFGSVATCLAKCKSTNGQRNGGILEKNQEKQRCSLAAKSEVPLHIFVIKTKVVHCHVELSTGWKGLRSNCLWPNSPTNKPAYNCSARQCRRLPLLTQNAIFPPLDTRQLVVGNKSHLGFNQPCFSVE